MRLLNKKDQNGLASIVIVSVLIVLLSLITVGFSVLMNRSVNNALNSQQGAAANYAAQSGINDVVNAIKTDANGPTDPLLNQTTCDSTYGGRITNNLSSDSSTSISCVLVNNQPQQLVYSPVDPFTSEFISLTGYKVSGIMFSWSSADGKNGYSPSATQLPDQQNWSYIPMLRVQIYQPQNGVQANNSNTSSTFFLMPNSGVAGGALTNTTYATSNGKIIAVNCKSTKPYSNKFQYDASYQCNATINGLANKPYYLRITPLYDQAALKVQALDNVPKPIAFNATQTVIDVTAKSGNAIKRLQERVDIDTNSEDISNSASATMPESALRTANSLCKRMVVDPTTGFTLDVKSSQDCASTGNPISVNTDGVDQAWPVFTLKGDVTSALSVSSCYFSVSKNQTFDAAGNLVPDTVSGTKMKFAATCPSGAPNNQAAFSYAFDASVAKYKSAGYLKAGLTLYYQACAIDSSNNLNCGGSLKFAESPPDPVVVTTNATIGSATAATLNGTVNPEGTAVNAYSSNYPGTNGKLPTSGCYFIYYDEKTPANLKYTNCAQGVGAGVKAVNVSKAVSGLTQGDRYWYYLCASKDNLNAQGIEYGHTVCDKTDLSLFVPRPLPVITTNAVDPGDLTTKAGSTILPTVKYNGTVKTNGWTIDNCIFYWNRENVNSPPDPLQNNHHPACNEDLTAISGGPPATAQAVSATDNLSAYSTWKNQWYVYVSYGHAHEPENPKVKWSAYGNPSKCFQAGHAGNPNYSANTDGNCGQTCNCQGTCAVAPDSPPSVDCSGGGCGDTCNYLLSLTNPSGNSFNFTGENLSGGPCDFTTNNPPGGAINGFTPSYNDSTSGYFTGGNGPATSASLNCGNNTVYLGVTPPPPPGLSITKYTTYQDPTNGGVWDQGPQCGPSTGINLYWLCRNGKPYDSNGYSTKITYPNGGPGCGESGHRWSTCNVYWTVSGGTGSGLSCTASVSGYGNFYTSSSYNVSTGRELWSNFGAVTTMQMTLSCTDSGTSSPVTKTITPDQHHSDLP